jgi:hypothetical protein
MLAQYNDLNKHNGWYTHQVCEKTGFQKTFKMSVIMLLFDNEDCSLEIQLSLYNTIQHNTNTVNQLIFAFICFKTVSRRFNFMITKMLKVQIFRGMIGLHHRRHRLFFYNKSCLSQYIIDRSIDIPH